MAKGIRKCVADADARFVLVTSAEAGDGKTTLLATLRDEFRTMEDGRVAFLGLSVLDKMSPEAFLDYEMVIIDGPSPGGAHAVLNLPRVWMEAMDGAILIVMKRGTTRGVLSDMSEWIKVAGLKTLGVVWNERIASPPSLAFVRFQSRLARAFGRRRRRAS